MKEDYLELSELQTGIKAGVEGFFPEKVWVKAEVASVQQKSNGHCYLDLCQSEDGEMVARAKAVIWRGKYFAIASYLRDTVGGPIQAGMQMLFRVQVSYSELYSLSLVIDEVEPCLTLGEAELEKRRTIERLEKEGLLNKQKALEMSVLPSRLAVISAPDAAGYGDFCRHLSNNAYGFTYEVQLFEATMQGQMAPESITDAIQAAECSRPAYDAILIMRGGGSVLDLACFDDYGLALAIATSSIPVFTAIGHDRDYHVADMVAHAFVKTPTALADEFIEAFAAEDERILSYHRRLKMAFLSHVASMEAKIENLRTRIQSSDPRNILSRGYVLSCGPDGRVAARASLYTKGDRLTVLFADGRIEATVDNVIIDNKKG